jgi:hypothetical protein
MDFLLFQWLRRLCASTFVNGLCSGAGELCWFFKCVFYDWSGSLLNTRSSISQILSSEEFSISTVLESKLEMSPFVNNSTVGNYDNLIRTLYRRKLVRNDHCGTSLSCLLYGCLNSSFGRRVKV